MKRREAIRNEIYIRLERKLIVEPGRHSLPERYLATALKNIEHLGFTFSGELMEAVRTLSVDDFAALYEETVQELKAIRGAHADYRPMYPNFPHQVMQADEAELYIQAILHYLTGMLPAYEELERLPFIGQTELDAIGLGSAEQFDAMIRKYISAKIAVSQEARAGVERAIAASNEEELAAMLPGEIPNKENAAFVISALLQHERFDKRLMINYVKTATDVLRLAVAMSGGDVSLASANLPFRKFKRSERRMLLGLLEPCAGLTEDMLRYKKRWIRLGEILHPGEYKHGFDRCKEAFSVLRNGLPYDTFGGMLERALLHKDVHAAVELLSKRPGEFVRRLDHLLRIAGEPQAVLREFEAVAAEVSTPVLLQVRAHFGRRHEKRELRTFFPKGNVAKAAAIANLLPALSPESCNAIVQVCDRALTQRFAKQSELGKVFVDERLKQYVVPFAERSASKALRTIVRGSRLELPPGDTIRFFTWWKEGMVNGAATGRVDIDLSAILYDENWKYVEHISYTNLRALRLKAVHSGDITSAPEGACEFIDLDIPSALEGGCRYLVASLNSYSEQPYCSLPECFAGWMMREHPASGRIFEPRTVVDKIDLAADTTIAIPVIIDLAERKLIWTDLALKQHPDYYNNVEGNQKGLVLMAKAMLALVKPSLYELFMLHAAARGQLVDRADEADTVFAPDCGITPFDTGTILADYVS
ncbi:cytoplasmic protein [Paenibacillus montanisoli]|uniref:Cytoplasmic protein n=2 Tax=Paenibacillus montanisoli TaxID=2081970 RepID=A0A328U688_9BACL|nr:cytoplasmic protein [Paenibacillus montanisoli]